MIVDDENFNIEAVKIMLQYSLKVDISICDTAMNGEEALEALKANVEKNRFRRCDYALILMDCNMPFCDGYTATKLIRDYLQENNIRQPIITATTGHVEPMYVDKAFESGMNQVLSKPVSKELLGSLLKKLFYL